MQIENIPAELKAVRQWVIWRSVIKTDPNTGKTSVTKPPYQPNNPHYLADVTDPKTWGSFNEAVQCVLANPSLIQGIGFVFTHDDDFFGIDIDDEAKVAEENLPMRKTMVGNILNNTSTYTEVSPSGKGLHIIGRGKLPVQGKRSTAIQIEIYGAERYLTVTGNVYKGLVNLVEQQELVDKIFESGGFPATQPQMAQVGNTDALRRTDLTDEQVIELAVAQHPNFGPRFRCEIDCQPGAWSDTFMMVVGVLDQITGLVEQVYRIVLASPMVTSAPPTADGETRQHKAERNFNHVLSRVRKNNTNHLTWVAHGKSIVENIERAKAERAKKAVEEILAQAEGAFSKNGLELFKAFPLPPECLKLTPPPGYVGNFVQATMGAVYNPFLKFAVPATMATLAGIVARAWKLPTGTGLNSNYILAAATATGKTQTMDAWAGFLERAARSIDNTLAGPSRSRIIKGSAGSIQGVFDDFMHTPSAVWFISECSSQLAQMSKPKSLVDAQLRDAYNDLYDASKVGRTFSPPRSVAAKKANMDPIENLSISTYWTTTTSKFDVFNDDAQDGFLSRVVIIRHAGRAGDAVPVWELQTELDYQLHEMLTTLLGLAKRFDETMIIAPHDGHKMVTIISTEQVDAKAWAFQQISERIKNASLDETLPVAYTAISRLPPLAMRLAGVLAVVENPYSPVITEEQYNWAFGYLLQNTAQLLSDMDKGEIGATMSQDVEVVLNSMRKLMRINKKASVSKSELADRLKRISPFKDAIPTPGQAIRNTMTEMLAHGVICEVQETNEKNQLVTRYSFTGETR